MRKRISSVLAGLLAALLLWGLAPVTAEAAGASFSGSGSVRAGDSVTVTFTVSGSNIQGITAVLHYDSSALTLTGHPPAGGLQLVRGYERRQPAGL